MAGKRGFLGGLFEDNCSILFFIIIFLILFYENKGYVVKRNPVDTQLDV
jgi:hypothetical protein